MITSSIINFATALDTFHVSSLRECTGFGAACEVVDYTFRGCAIEDMSAVNFPVLIFSREFREFEDHFT